MGAVNMPETHQFQFHLCHPFLEGAITAELNLVFSAVCGIQDTIRWSMTDQHIDIIWNPLPDSIDGAAIFHVCPAPIAGCPRGSPEFDPIQGELLVNQKIDAKTFDEVTGDQALLNRSVVVAGNKDLCWDWQGSKPLDERAHLGFVAIGIEPV